MKVHNQNMDSIENVSDEDDIRNYHQNIRNRCGEIFFEDDKLKYCCLFCQEDFGQISTFINHLYRLHLFMDPPSFEQDTKSQLLIDNDCVRTDDRQYLIDENKEAFCTLENNEEQKFIADLDIGEDDRISNNSNMEDDLYELKEESQNLFNECKVEIIENDTKIEENPETLIYDNEINKNQCNICLKILSSERSLKRHHLIHQNIKDTKSNVINKFSFPRGEDDKFHCNLCANSYSRIDSLRRHIKKHWGSNNCAKCEICSKVLSSKPHLKAHMRVHTATLAKCELCSKILSSKVRLKAHMRVHTGERPHKCNFCPAAFADRTNFDRHIRIHLGDKRYNCDYCDKTFIQRSEKKIHERMVHTKERPFQCEICGRKFFNGVTLNDHKKRHTNTRPCECEVCGKRFYNRKLLNDHKISHSNEKPHSCDICSAKFARRKALRQHVKIHSNIKEYVCTICNKAFAQNAGLYSHMKSHTGNPQTPNNVTV